MRHSIKLLIVVLLMCGCGGSDPVAKVQPVKPLATPANSNDVKPTVAVPDAKKIVLKASEYLWNKQADDGSWKSDSYELLKSGRTLTPYVLYALTETDPQPPQKSVEKALEFMRSEIHHGGFSVEGADVEEPFCPTAYALMCFKKFGKPEDGDLIQSMQEHLVQQQLTEARELEVTHPSYGGWGFDQSLNDRSLRKQTGETA